MSLRSAPWQAAFLASMGFASGPLWAQQDSVIPVSADEEPTNSQSQPASSANRSRFVEEIIVTAQKREENLQDVPISVQAFSADALDARGIEEPKALQFSTPGMSYNVFASYSLIYIRGIGTDAFIPSADASVATYIDNVYRPFGLGLASALGAVERVEILKGPQGTLFGRNSTGGAINIVTKQPGPVAETSVLVSRESYDKTNFRVYTNVPLSDELAFSISGLSYSEDSYYKRNEASPLEGDLPTEISRGFALKGRWKPFDGLTATAGHTYTHYQGSQFELLTVKEVTPLGVLTGVQVAPDYETSEDVPSFVEARSHVTTLDLQYTAPWFDLRLIGSDQYTNAPAIADFDGSASPVARFFSPRTFADAKTAEFQILSNDDSWAADRLKWIVGLYYIESTAGYDPVELSLGPNLIQKLANPPPDGPLALLGSAFGPLFDVIAGLPGVGQDGLLGIVNDGATLQMRGVLDTESTAAFFQTTYNFTDELALTLGGRYQTETRKLAKASSGVRVGEAVIPLPFDLQPGRSEDTSNFSPKVVLDYKLDNDMFYASFSQGFKSGTYNIIAIYLPGQYIVPEKVTSYELGYKGTLFNGGLRFNAAVFQNEIEDLQVQTISLISGGAVRFETAGGARIRGADFDLTLQPLPSSLPDLVLTASGAYLDGEYTDYDNGSGYNDAGIFTTGLDFTGNDVVRTPKYSGNAGLAYTFYEQLGGDIELAADVYYNSGSNFTAQNRASSKHPSYSLLNARISYFYQPWGTRITVFGKNITDEKYYNVISDLDFGTAKVLAAPATYGVRLNWDF